MICRKKAVIAMPAIALRAGGSGGGLPPSGGATAGDQAGVGNDAAMWLVNREIF